MMAAKGLIINLWVALACLQASILSGSDSVAMAWKGTKTFSSAISSRVLPIRGGDIVYLKTIEEAEEIVAENTSNDDQLVVMYFSANNCPPCKKVAPLFEEMCAEFEENESKVVFCKVNVDENPLTAQKYQVTGWPAFLFLKKGEKVMEIVGGNLAEATLYDWVKLLEPKEKKEEEKGNDAEAVEEDVEEKESDAEGE